MEMQSIRIEPQDGGEVLLIDVVCDCGQNGLRNEDTGETSFKHRVALGATGGNVLACGCGKRYRLHPQGTHIHIFAL